MSVKTLIHIALVDDGVDCRYAVATRRDGAPLMAALTEAQALARAWQCEVELDVGSHWPHLWVHAATNIDRVCAALYNLWRMKQTPEES
jgi:hypothetical protein